MLKHAILCTLSLIILSPAAYAIDIHQYAAHKKAQALGFQPHKALYDIRLAGARSGSQVLNISGKMFYEWQAGCDAWTTNHRFNILYEYADSEAMRITSNFTTHEKFDGTALNFTSQRKRNGMVFEDVRGHATITPGFDGEAIYSIPENLTFDLPKGTLFPIDHSLKLAQKMKDGQTLYNATIFDGSDEEGPVAVNAFLGKSILKTVAEQKNTALANAINQDLYNSPMHNTRLAFFPLSQDEASSDYEMNIAVHDNSVISDMRIDYDDFSVNQTLIALEPVEDGCKTPKRAK